MITVIGPDFAPNLFPEIPSFVPGTIMRSHYSLGYSGGRSIDVAHTVRGLALFGAMVTLVLSLSRYRVVETIIAACDELGVQRQALLISIALLYWNLRAWSSPVAKESNCLQATYRSVCPIFIHRATQLHWQL